MGNCFKFLFNHSKQSREISRTAKKAGEAGCFLFDRLSSLFWRDDFGVLLSPLNQLANFFWIQEIGWTSPSF